MSELVVRHFVTESTSNDSGVIPDAVSFGGLMVSVQIPLRTDGVREEGSIHAQTSVTLENLRTTLQVLGLGLDRVMHATIYLTDMADQKGMDSVWRDVFHEGSPSRATIGVSALAGGWMRIEVVAFIAE